MLENTEVRLRYRRLLPAQLRVATSALRQDVTNVVRALTERRTRVCRVEYEGVEVEVEIELQEPVDRSPVAVEPQMDAEAVATLVFSRSGVSLDVSDPTQTILEAGLAAGIDLVYSCTLGGCAACMVDVIEGDVDYEDPDAICLLEEEIETGDICLACVGRPRGRVLIDA